MIKVCGIVVGFLLGLRVLSGESRHRLAHARCFCRLARSFRLRPSSVSAKPLRFHAHMVAFAVTFPRCLNKVDHGPRVPKSLPRDVVLLQNRPGRSLNHGDRRRHSFLPTIMVAFVGVVAIVPPVNPCA